MSEKSCEYDDRKRRLRRRALRERSDERRA